MLYSIKFERLKKAFSDVFFALCHTNSMIWSDLNDKLTACSQTVVMLTECVFSFCCNVNNSFMFDCI